MRTFLLALLGLVVSLVLGVRGARVVLARTVDEALEEVRGPARARLAARGVDVEALRRGAAELVLVGVKDAQRLELWARMGGDPRAHHLTDYPVLAASGGPGPKLLEGDRQVPEGVYRVAGLNPNSRFHLSLKVDFPNAFDRARAAEDGRANPGSDIFIHGGARSVGCLAIGDPAIEELFVLVVALGLDRVGVLLCPSDPRVPFDRAGARELPPWIGDLDAQLDGELRRLGVR